MRAFCHDLSLETTEKFKIRPFQSAIWLGLLSLSRYRGANIFVQRLFVMIIVSGGISIFGLFSINPALFAFLLVTIVFGGLNIFEFKRFD